MTKSFEHFSYCVASLVTGKLLKWDGNKKTTRHLLLRGTTFYTPPYSQSAHGLHLDVALAPKDPNIHVS